ncbi:CBS domain-containing protein [Vitiosangium sp. GDMCC 1.1324]|uniref:CBS domain-containing protein n=1 Tax=Vitiosangium sp. (strain GDMCC 1.1324) TaxID=2138576 RepID=UPI000D367634|nr:CBS domain-containing protein [Vitiosangium sp. GDMCC 1.1324]PTL76581.1 CBS domain-containing protein [Vitiosangium sp. GDMCC 1.1324]
MAKLIREVMTRDVEVINPNDTLRDAAEKMRTLNVGAIPVCDGQRVVGMITDRDVVVRAIALGKDPNSTQVADAMSPGIEYAFDDDDVDTVLNRLKEKQIRRIIVVDRSKKLVGVASLGDLTGEVSERKVGEALEGISEPSSPNM